MLSCETVLPSSFVKLHERHQAVELSECASDKMAIAGNQATFY